MISHLGLIMDGNRRWARARGLPPFLGHKAGVDTVKKMVTYCLQKGIAHLSLYTFSIENLKRSEQEKSFLFDLVIASIKEYVAQVAKEGVRVRFVGDRSLFPAHVLTACQEMEAQTASMSKLTLNILFCYGGQHEIVAGVKECLARHVDPNTLTPDTFRQLLWSGHSPAPEVVIRTGGVARLSNFLLFSCAYSELFFTHTFWPDFSEQELDEIMARYAQIKRNFGQ